ncbi:hypothetical protein GCM10009689_17410 [Brevibacterium antiquum]|uniref:hypothetical protein n=1 Tax=Brevibacterium antiquum TaxID=234835 RepID=UPI0018DEF474|nr:hypothetical protein [Brevibacterium antiquum]
MDCLKDFIAIADRLALHGWVKPTLKARLDQSLTAVAPNDLDADSRTWIKESVTHPGALQPVLCAITAINTRAANLAEAATT